MSENIRLVILLLCFAGMAYGIYWAVDNALSETLDEGSIRTVIKQVDASIKNPKATRDLMEKRLDANYVRTGVLIRAIRDKPDETIPVTKNKAQSIEAAMQGLSVTTITKYEHKIIDIKFSSDKKYAYVSSTETSTGTFNLPAPDGKQVTLPFNAGGACVDTLTLVRAVISFVRSECTNKIALLQ